MGLFQKRHKITINVGECHPSRSFLRAMKRAARKALQYLEIDMPVQVDVSLVKKEEIRRLNRENRDIDRVTDVLSFPQCNLTPGVPLSEACDETDIIRGRVFLGDVVICYPVALRQAIDLHHSHQRELGFLTVHSILHLLGYDHMNPEEEQQMFGITEEIMLLADLPRVES